MKRNRKIKLQDMLIEETILMRKGKGRTIAIKHHKTIHKTKGVPHQLHQGKTTNIILF